MHEMLTRQRLDLFSWCHHRNMAVLLYNLCSPGLMLESSFFAAIFLKKFLVLKIKFLGANIRIHDIIWIS